MTTKLLKKGNITKHRFEAGNREAWLELRNSLTGMVGGSQIGSIANHSEYSSYLKELEYETGLIPRPVLDKKMAVKLGHVLEQQVAVEFSEVSGKSVHNENCVFTNDAYPHLKASIDRKIANEDSGLECKTMLGMAFLSLKEGEFPMAYLDQIVCYLAITQLARWYLAIMTPYGMHYYLMTRVREEADRYAELKARYAYADRDAVQDEPDYAEWVKDWSYLEAVYFVDDDTLQAAEDLAADFIGKVNEVKEYMANRTFNTDTERKSFLRTAIEQVISIENLKVTECGERESNDENAAIAALLSDTLTPELTLASDSDDEKNLVEKLARRADLKRQTDEIKTEIDAIEKEVTLIAISKKAEVVKTAGWKVSYKVAEGRRTASVANIEKYFSTRGEEVPEGLISVSEAKPALRISEVKAKSSRGKKAA